MSFFASLVPALLQGVMGGLGGAPAPAAPVVDAGVQSAVGASAPPPMAENPVGGTGFSDLVSQGVKSVIGAKVGQWKAGMAGTANRDYLDAAFPELNPWEKAGASATNAGVGMEGIGNQSDMQTKELATRVGMQDQQIAFGKEQLAAQERMNAVSAAAGVQSATIGQGPNWALNPYNIALAEANTRLADERSNRESVESAATMDRTTQSWIDSIPKILMSGKSGFGTVRTDDNFKSDAIKAAVAGDAYNGVKSMISGGGFGKIGKWIKPWFGRSGSGPAVSKSTEPPVSGSSVLE